MFKKVKYQEVLNKLKSLSDPEAKEGMGRFGINVSRALGVSVYQLRRLAKTIGKDHRLAARLWKSKIHEAMILAALIDEPALVTENQMEEWVEDFDSWDLCDQVCSNLFGRTGLARKKVFQWSRRKDEFVRRASFALIAALSVHDKKAPDRNFEGFLPLIKKCSEDERNFVRKAVNWALRQIGKRNLRLNKKAIKVAEEIRKIGSPAARWIASDALRELTSEKVRERLIKQ